MHHQTMHKLFYNPEFVIVDRFALSYMNPDNHTDVYAKIPNIYMHITSNTQNWHRIE